jgi:hypothetical protein
MLLMVMTTTAGPTAPVNPGRRLSRTRVLHKKAEIEKKVFVQKIVKWKQNGQPSLFWIISYSNHSVYQGNKQKLFWRLIVPLWIFVLDRFSEKRKVLVFGSRSFPPSGIMKFLKFHSPFYNHQFLIKIKYIESKTFLFYKIHFKKTLNILNNEEGG